MDRILIGTRKGLFFAQRGKTRWGIVRDEFLGVPVTMTLTDPRDGATYAALDHGHFGVKLHRAEKGAKKFTELPAPAYPPKPEGFVDLDPWRKTERAWALKLIWSLETGGAQRPGRLWCGTLPGGLFRSDDSGQSWQLMRSLWDNPSRAKWSGGGYDLPGIHSITVDPRNPDRVVIAVSTGGVWETRDAGASWQVGGKGLRAEYVPPERAGEPEAQDPHRVVRCAAAPDTMWMQHHNGIFRSRDAGLTWTEIERAGPSTFGFAVAVHPQKPDTAWFVPATKDMQRYPVGAKVVVTHTQDGGKSFDVFRRGLPQRRAYDLVYRHGMDVDGEGRRLVIGSTTGSVWISEDGGEGWSPLARNLPPVYSVRFG